MKRLLLLLALLLSTAPSSAIAQPPGVNLSWNNCDASLAGGLNKVSTCQSNTEAAKVFFGSYILPADATALVGNDIILQVMTNSGSLPCWWNFTVGPRVAGFAVDANVPCADNAFNYWGTLPSGATTSAVAELLPNASNSRFQIHVVVGARAEEAQPVPQSIGEIFSFRFQLKFDATVGGSCTGCLTSACFILGRLIVGQAGGPEFALTQASSRNFIFWQGGAVAAPGCPPVDGGSFPPVPTLNQTWGSVKALYR